MRLARQRQRPLADIGKLAYAWSMRDSLFDLGFQKDAFVNKSSSALEAILSYFIVQFWTIGLGAFWFSGRIWASGSAIADPETYRTVRLTSRGEWSYVEPWQSHLLHGSLLGGFLGFLVLAILLQRWIGKGISPKFHPIASTAGLVGGALFWMAVAKFGGV